MPKPFTYGLNSYTGAQLLERQTPPNHNRPRFNLRLTDNQQDTLTNFCTQYRIGGPQAIPSPPFLLSLADDLNMLHVGEADDAVKELFRRLVGKLVQLPGHKGGCDADEDVLFGGTQGEAISEAFALWDERNKARVEKERKQEQRAKITGKGKGKATAPAPAQARAPVKIKQEPVVEEQQQLLQAVEEEEEQEQEEEAPAVAPNAALTKLMFQHQVLQDAKQSLEDELAGLQV